MKIILLRHGQYKKDPESLTSLGVHQAQLVAKRIEDYEISEILSSTMPRAIETSFWVRKKLGEHIPYHESDCLRECLPGLSEKESLEFPDISKQELERDKRQADIAYEKFLLNREGEKEYFISLPWKYNSLSCV